MLKVTVSGSFRTEAGTDKKRYNFTKITGVMPDCPEEYILSHAMRMFPVWKNETKALDGINFDGIIKLYIDNVEEVDGEPLCVGKDIKEMTWEELQSMACYLMIREIPLYRSGALRSAQEKAYEMYQAKVLDKRVFKTAQDISRFKDDLRRNLEALMVSEQETNRRVDEAVEKGFSMLTDPHNPQNSYSFAKLPSIFIKGKKVDSPKKEEYNSNTPKNKAKKVTTPVVE